MKKYFNSLLSWIKTHSFLACSYIFVMVVIIVAIVAAAHIGYSLAEIQCAIKHGGASAPQSVVLFLLIPYGFVELVLVGAAGVSRFLHSKKSKIKNLEHK